MTTGKHEYWAHTLQIGTHSVYMFERLDRGRALHVKFTSPSRTGRDRRQKLKLPGDFTVRDKKGNVDPKMVAKVEKAVEQFVAPMLLLGAPAPTKALPSESLTLGRAFDLALDLEKGKYPSKTLRWQEVDRARKKLERILGSSAPLESLDAGDVTKVWRTLAKEYASGVGKAGPRQAEVTVDALYSVAAWLRERRHIKPDVLLPISKWRSRLNDEWTKLTGNEVKPDRHRHTPEELVALFKHMYDPRVDPRFALAFDLGGEQRIGQVLRAKRSQLHLPPVVTDGASGKPGEFGLLRIPGNKKKPAQSVMLTANQRRAVEAALSGYLSGLEELYRAGQLADYFLFPSERLKKGKAKVKEEFKPLTKDAALGMFRQLEEIAGVKYVKGRGWYGVRRQATDLAEDIEKDERVLNSISGHRNSETRRQIYQESERPEVLAKAAEVRAKLRQGSVGEPSATYEIAESA
jgi:integrase